MQKGTLVDKRYYYLPFSEKAFCINGHSYLSPVDVCKVLSCLLLFGHHAPPPALIFHLTFLLAVGVTNLYTLNVLVSAKMFIHILILVDMIT